MTPVDLRYSLRSLKRNPWYSLSIIAVIALTMALGVTVFAVVDGVLFKPLPYPHAEELYVISGGYRRGQSSGIVVAPRNARDWAAAIPGSQIALWSGGGGGGRLGDVHAWVPSPASVDEHFFEVLGVQPLIGGFRVADFEQEVSPSPVIISYGIWQSRFGGRPDVIGQPLIVSDTVTYRVAGVLPRDFLFPITWRIQPNVLSPIIIPPDQRQTLRYRCCGAIARIPAGVSVAQLQERLDAAANAEVGDWITRPTDGSPAFDHVGLERIETALTYRQRPMFATVFATAAVLLLLGCVNISGLMTSRARDRATELTVRRALGADFLSLARLLVAESLLLAVVGTAIGVLIVPAVLHTIVGLMPDRLGVLKQPAVDLRVMIAAATGTFVIAILTACLPIHRAVRTTGAFVRTSMQVAGQRRFGRMVVVASQIALGLALTVSGVLVVGTLIRIRSNDLGFSSSRLLILEGLVQGNSVADRLAEIGRVTTAVGHLPGVTAVGATQSPLLRRSVLLNAFTGGATYAVTPGFFESVGLTLVAGRWPNAQEMETGAAVAVISERVGHRTFPGRTGIGETLQSSKGPVAVVGVVRDSRLAAWDSDGQGQIFAPYRLVADSQSRISIAIRTATDVAGASTMASVVRRPDQFGKDVQITSLATAPDLLADTIRDRRLQAWIFGAFAAAALLIVGTGILGLVAMSTARRTHEIGIRMALGATRPRIVGLLIREQLVAATLGLLVGGIVAAWAVKFVRAYVSQVAPYDPRLWGIALGLVVTTTIAGAAVPSWRASRTNSMDALRIE